MSLPALPARRTDSHKGDYGRTLLVGGSRGMAGAIGLSGMAALRMGAGLVTLAIPADCLTTVAAYEPCYTTVPLPCDREGRIRLEAAEGALQRSLDMDAAGLGPGLGRSSELNRFVARLVRRIACPLVVDADGLNAVADVPNVWSRARGPRILTPHPGELARLAGTDIPSRSEAIRHTRRLAKQWNVVIALKGHRTYVTDGIAEYTNATGNPGMATGGAGDVLTGILVALLGQGMAPFDAACLGVYLHGSAGDLAAERWGYWGLTARDLVPALADACQLHHKNALHPTTNSCS